MSYDPEIKWWTPDEVDLEVTVPPLVSSFGDGICVVAMKVSAIGDYQVSWTVNIDGSTRNLRDVESFIGRVASFIIREPVEAED